MKRSRSKKIHKHSFGVTINGIEYESKTPKRISYVTEISYKLADAYNLFEKHQIVLTYGSFLIMLVFVLFSSLPDYQDKSMYELGNSMLIYFLGGTVGQYVIKDTLYALGAYGIENIKKVDKNLEDAKEKIEYLQEIGAITSDMYDLYDQCTHIYSIQKTTEEEKINVMKFINLIVVLGSCKLDKQYTADAYDIAQVIEKLNIFMNDYGNASEALEYNIINPILNNMANNVSKYAPPISPIFLVGEPGVGKTRFIKSLADIIGATIFEYKPLDLDYSRLDLYKNYEPQANDFSTFTKSIISNSKFKIIFIDEIDKKIRNDNDLLESLLVMLGDTSDREVYDRYLHFKVTLPKDIIIVVASNKTIDQLIAQNNELFALKSRFVEIYIPNMEKTLQIKIINDYLQDNNIILNPEYVEQLVNKTNYPGVRELLKIINSYITHLNSIENLSKYKNIISIDEYHNNYMQTLNQMTDEAAQEIIQEVNYENQYTIENQYAIEDNPNNFI